MRESRFTSCLAILVAIAVISPIGPTSLAQSSKIQAQIKFEAASLAIEEKQFDEALTLANESKESLENLLGSFIIINSFPMPCILAKRTLSIFQFLFNNIMYMF